MCEAQRELEPSWPSKTEREPLIKTSGQSFPCIGAPQTWSNISAMNMCLKTTLGRLVLLPTMMKRENCNLLGHSNHSAQTRINAAFPPPRCFHLTINAATVFGCLKSNIMFGCFQKWNYETKSGADISERKLWHWSSNKAVASPLRTRLQLI